jgi:thioredoxin reductase (NADPH)
MNNHQNTQAQIAIVGAGPIGIEMAAVLKRAGANYIHFEAKQIGDTISWWPRNTYFFSTTERIELAGIPIPNTTQQRTSGEEYLAYLRGIVEQLDLQIHTYEPVVDLLPDTDGFRLHTRPLGSEREYFCKYVILATGDMQYPNLLGIPGEDLPHVSHYFRDPHMYFRKRLLIVGGRNSAVEAALRCWRAGSRVTLSYRQKSFDPKTIKHFLLPDLQTQIELGTINYLPATIPVEIKPQEVVLERVDDEGRPTGEKVYQQADFVLLTTGFHADMRLFEQAGVRLEGPDQVPDFDPETMETNVPGLFVAGVAAAGSQSKYSLFIENSHEHVGKIARALTGKWPEKLGTVPERQYVVDIEKIRAD